MIRFSSWLKSASQRQHLPTVTHLLVCVYSIFELGSRKKPLIPISPYIVLLLGTTLYEWVCQALLHQGFGHCFRIKSCLYFCYLLVFGPLFLSLQSSFVFLWVCLYAVVLCVACFCLSSACRYAQHLFPFDTHSLCNLQIAPPYFEGAHTHAHTHAHTQIDTHR